MESIPEGSTAHWQVFGHAVSPSADLRAFSAKDSDDDLASARKRRRRRGTPTVAPRTASGH